MKLHHTSRLKFFCDDATGDYGVAPIETICNDFSFNAAWHGRMIFHDVFEHYCEFRHPWFQGDNAMNVGGEMFAMGHMMYYVDTLGLTKRLYSMDFNSNATIMVNSTSSEIIDAIRSGYCNYGDILNSGVPHQKPTDCIELEYGLEEYIKKVKHLKPSEREDEKDFAQQYKKSVTESKIKNLHRAGYYAAQKLVPDNKDNYLVLIDFIEFWEEFTKINDAKLLYESGILYLDFNIYINGYDVISWEVFAVSSYGYSVKLKRDMDLCEHIQEKEPALAGE